MLCSEQIYRLEGRLRKSGEMDLLNLMWEMGVDITLYPSRYTIKGTRGVISR